jgi:hypothetical protein
MKSPFPGMDPYLELHWRDVHHSLCTYARDALQPQVRPALFARIDERLVVESDIADDRSIYPDVKVVESRDSFGSNAGESATAVAEPLVVRVSEKPKQGFIQIIDPSTGGKLVTVIEFLSPANKSAGDGQKQYRQKQQELRDAGVSLVEIDLLYSPAWVLGAPLRNVPQSHRKPYRVCVNRGWIGIEYELYRMPIQQRLPQIKIPLREQDADARLDLQVLIDQTYLNGAYDQINYKNELAIAEMPVEVSDWIDKTLREAGRR